MQSTLNPAGSDFRLSTQVVLVVKNPPANARDIRDMSLIPGLGISPLEGNGNPLQYSCLENSMDREAWQFTVHGVTESDTTEHTHTHMLINNIRFKYRFHLLKISLWQTKLNIASW